MIEIHGVRLPVAQHLVKAKVVVKTSIIRLAATVIAASARPNMRNAAR